VRGCAFTGEGLGRTGTRAYLGQQHAGMGREHYSYPLRVDSGESWHFHDLTGQHIRQFRDLTRQRTDQATQGS
jgi:hypothetical protein